MTRLLPLAALLVACHPRELPAPDVTDPAALYARAQAEAPSGAVYAPFDVVLALPDQRLSLNGVLVVSPPGRFRVELKGPIGPAQLVLTCDGTDVRVWVAPKAQFYVVDEADAALGTLLGADGVRGAELVAALLLGRVPDLGVAPTLRAEGPVGTLLWRRADDARFQVGLDGRTAHVFDARADDPTGQLVFWAAYKPTATFPSALAVQLPTLHAEADVRFREWAPATPTDAAFRMEAPAGAVVVPWSPPAAAAPAPGGP